MTIVGGDGPLPNKQDFLVIDGKLAEEGVSALDRPRAAARKWAEKSGDMMIALKQERWFKEQYSKLHPSVPFGGAAFLTLCVSARAISYPIKPPMVFGRMALKPIEYVDITQAELKRLWDAHPESFWELTYQGFDCIDLFMAHVNYHPNAASVTNMMRTSINQMTASARQLVAGEIDLSIPQGLAMAVELAGKSVLQKEGATQDDLKAVGHNLVKLADVVGDKVTSPIDDQVKAVSATLPKYVAVRYDAPVLNMTEAQDIYRRALFVIADYLRRTNHSQGYWDIVKERQMPPRDWSSFV